MEENKPVEVPVTEVTTTPVVEPQLTSTSSLIAPVEQVVPATESHPIETPLSVVEVQPVEEFKKKFIVLPIVLIIVATLLIAFGATYKNGSPVEEDGNDEVEVVIEEDDCDDDEQDNKIYEEEILNKESVVVQKLFRIFAAAEYPGEYQEANETYKKRVTINSLDPTKDIKIKTCGDLDQFYYFEKDVNWFCSVYFNTDELNNLKDKKAIERIRNEIKDKNAKTISSKCLHKKYNKIFEGTFEDKTEDLGGCMNLLYYDKLHKRYTTNFLIPNTGCKTEQVYNDLKDINQENGQLTLKVGITIESQTEKLIDYTFKFDKNTGNYIFVSRVVNK